LLTVEHYTDQLCRFWYHSPKFLYSYN